MERSRPNPHYRSVKAEMSIWEPEFGFYLLREYRRRAGRIYLRGATASGATIIVTWDLPAPFKAGDYLGETAVIWK